jgi:hypothetical protein
MGLGLDWEKRKQHVSMHLGGVEQDKRIGKWTSLPMR